MRGARELAMRAAEEAGKLLKDRFNKHHDVHLKAHREIVTEADLASEKLILGMIREKFPEHSILSEEAGRSGKDSEYMWVVDPLDGTTNYSIRNPFFNVSIGLVKSNEVVLAVTYAPMTKEMYVAEKGKGATLNGKPIRVSEEASVSNAMMAYCQGNRPEDVKRVVGIFSKIRPAVKDLNRMRSGALELAFVAAGRLAAYIANDTTPWDAAAGCLLIREAGGKVTDFKGSEWDVNTRDILASNGKIHDEILQLIKGG